jgi:hypothetical protein
VEANARETVNPEVWQMVLRHYPKSELAGILGVSRQAVHSAIMRNRMPGKWAGILHRESKGILDARILCPEIFMGVF